MTLVAKNPERYGKTAGGVLSTCRHCNKQIGRVRVPYNDENDAVIWMHFVGVWMEQECPGSTDLTMFAETQNDYLQRIQRKLEASIDLETDAVRRRYHLMDIDFLLQLRAQKRAIYIDVVDDESQATQERAASVAAAAAAWHAACPGHVCEADWPIEVELVCEAKNGDLLRFRFPIT